MPKRPPAEDDEPRRPKKRPRVPDDDDEPVARQRPKKKRQQPQSSSQARLYVAIGGGGAALLLLLVLTAFVWPGFLRSRPQPQNQGPDQAQNDGKDAAGGAKDKSKPATFARKQAPDLKQLLTQARDAGAKDALPDETLLLIAAHQGHLAVKTKDKSLLAEMRKTIAPCAVLQLDALCLIAEYEARLGDAGKARATLAEVVKIVKKTPANNLQNVDFLLAIDSMARCGVYARDPTFFELAKKTAEENAKDFSHFTIEIARSRYAADKGDAGLFEQALKSQAFQVELDELGDTFRAEGLREMFRMQLRPALAKKDRAQLDRLSAALTQATLKTRTERAWCEMALAYARLGDKARAQTLFGQVQQTIGQFDGESLIHALGEAASATKDPAFLAEADKIANREIDPKRRMDLDWRIAWGYARLGAAAADAKYFAEARARILKHAKGIFGFNLEKLVAAQVELALATSNAKLLAEAEQLVFPPGKQADPFRIDSADEALAVGCIRMAAKTGDIGLITKGLDMVKRGQIGQDKKYRAIAAALAETGHYPTPEELTPSPSSEMRANVSLGLAQGIMLKKGWRLPPKNWGQLGFSFDPDDE